MVDKSEHLLHFICKIGFQKKSRMFIMSYARNTYSNIYT